MYHLLQIEREVSRIGMIPKFACNYKPSFLASLGMKDGRVGVVYRGFTPPATIFRPFRDFFEDLQ